MKRTALINFLKETLKSFSLFIRCACWIHPVVPVVDTSPSLSPIAWCSKQMASTDGHLLQFGKSLGRWSWLADLKKKVGWSSTCRVEGGKSSSSSPQSLGWWIQCLIFQRRWKPRSDLVCYRRVCVRVYGLAAAENDAVAKVCRNSTNFRILRVGWIAQFGCSLLSMEKVTWIFSSWENLQKLY